MILEEHQPQNILPETIVDHTPRFETPDMPLPQLKAFVSSWQRSIPRAFARPDISRVADNTVRVWLIENVDKFMQGVFESKVVEYVLAVLKEKKCDPDFTLHDLHYFMGKSWYPTCSCSLPLCCLTRYCCYYVA